MNQILFFALWISAFSTLLIAQQFVHKKHVEALRDDLLKFESEWKRLEKLNAKV